MIDLYYWPTSNGRKITIMLHEADLPYNIIPVNFKTGEQYAPDYLRINPNNKIPAIMDRVPPGGGEPVTIFESVAILTYLAEKSGRLMPRDVRGRYDVMKWAIFQGASIGPMLARWRIFTIMPSRRCRPHLIATKTRHGASTGCWSAGSARPNTSQATTRSPTSRFGLGFSLRDRSSASKTIQI